MHSQAKLLIHTLLYCESSSVAIFSFHLFTNGESLNMMLWVYQQHLCIYAYQISTAATRRYNSYTLTTSFGNVS